jgi:two-component system, NtrC family, response regulator AtoC
MNKKEKILIVDDEKIIRESLFHWFENEGYHVDIAENGELGLAKCKNEKFDLLLVDMKLPGIGGLELLKAVKEIDNDTIVIMITAFASVPSAITAFKEGAYDYVTKPVDPDELTHLVEKALEQKTLKFEYNQLKESIEAIVTSGNLIGESFHMRKLNELIRTVSSTDSTVLINGECGVGKELVAKKIHLSSKRKYFPFISVKCGALTESLLESELFGEEAGAESGSQIRKKGKFEIINGGTLYLDEVCSISLKMQVEILKVLETKQFSRVGGNEVIKSDFRLISASNERLESLVKEGKFREDLYYKLNVFSILIPPLRDRKEDIITIARFFVKKFSTAMNKTVKEISDDASDFLINYDWPGNVRELENAIERAVVVGKSDLISVDDLPFRVSSVSIDADEGKKSLSAIEKKYILKVLNENNWNISRSAQILEIDRVTLYNKINKYRLRTRVH